MCKKKAYKFSGIHFYFRRYTRNSILNNKPKKYKELNTVLLSPKGNAIFAKENKNNSEIDSKSCEKSFIQSESNIPTSFNIPSDSHLVDKKINKLPNKNPLLTKSESSNANLSNFTIQFLRSKSSKDLYKKLDIKKLNKSIFNQSSKGNMNIAKNNKTNVKNTSKFISYYHIERMTRFINIIQ